MAQSYSISVTGMSCASCVGRVEAIAREVPGVLTADANLASGHIQIDSARPEAARAVADALDAAGYDTAKSIVRLNVQGLSCASCVRRVEQALAHEPGVLSASINLATGEAEVRGIEGAGTAEHYAQVLTDAGYPAHAVDPRKRTKDVAKDPDLFRQATIAAILTVPIVVLEMGSHIFPAFHAFIHRTIGHEMSWAVQAVLATAVLAGPGREFFRRGLPALWRRAPDMNALVALGTGAAWSFSMVALLAPGILPPGAGAVYFEAAAVIATLILVGRALEARAKGRAGAAIRRLMELQPQTVRLIRDGVVIETDVASVCVGDHLEARPGDAFAVDGAVTAGQSYVDESMISGEPVPVAKSAGDKVTAGTVNGRGALTYRADAVGSETVLARIIDMVTRAQNAKLPIQALVDRVTAVFVPVIVALALLTWAVWTIFGPLGAGNMGLVAAISVLIVACPCAMGLATPMSIMVGMGRAAELGVLFRKGDALQTLGRVRAVAFDKTGTLTRGVPVMTSLIPTEGWTSDEVLAVAAAVEARSEHPIARAVVQTADARGIDLPAVTGFEARAGQGVVASVDGARVHVGTQKWLAAQGIPSAALDAEMHKVLSSGQTAFCVAVDGQPAGVIGVSDPVKPEAAAVVAALADKGLHVAMITGDRAETADVIAGQLGIGEVTAGVLPDGKQEALAALRAAHGPVAFVGDGINDAPSLAAADVGIALGTGTDVAIEAADVVLMSADVQGVMRARAISRATLANIRQNLFWAFAYNVALIPVAAGVLFPLTGTLLSPMLAAGAMAMSSVFVVGNALRLRWIAQDKAAVPAWDEDQIRPISEVAQ